VGLEELGGATEQRGALALGGGQFTGRLPQALLGVPDDIWLDLVAVRRQHQLALDDEMLRPQGEKRLCDVAEVGARFLDHRAELLETARRFGADLARLAVDRHLAAESGGVRDALRRNGA